MEVDSYYRIIALVILIILSALFSGSEVALFSLDKKKLFDKEKKTLLINYINSLLDFPRRLLVTILLGNTIVNVAASIIAVAIAFDISTAYQISLELALLIQIVVLTLLILLFGEITPKVFASKFPLRFAKIIALPLYWTSVLLYPIAKILTDVIKSFASKLKYDQSKTALLSTEITELADLGVEKGTLEEDEHDLIHGLVTFRTVTVREVMTPRVDIKAVSVDMPFNELMQLITDSGHSRIPLFEDNLDNVVGVIYAKDLLPYIGSQEKRDVIQLRQISRKTMFVPETKLISELMHEFQEKNMHMGIVVDEYGGTAGLVSLEDILEEIVGEIRDEYDKEENEVTKLNETSYMLLGKMPIDELSTLLDREFSTEDDDYDTVGGFIFNHAGKIPDEGFTVTEGDFKFTVKEIYNKRIKRVLVEKIESAELNSEDEK